MVRSPFRLSLYLAAAAAAVGCSGESTTGIDVLAVSAVEISPPGASVRVGETQQLTATPKTSSGIAVPNRSVRWSSANGAVATVSASGLETGIAVGGPVNITATGTRCRRVPRSR